MFTAKQQTGCACAQNIVRDKFDLKCFGYFNFFRTLENNLIVT